MSQRARGKLVFPSRRRLFKLILIGVFGGLGVTNLAFIVHDVKEQSEPRSYEICCQTPQDWGFAYEDIAVSSGEVEGGEVTLRGWYIPSRNRAAILLIHSGGASRMGVASFAAFLTEAGYGTLLYDRRANGESTGDIRTSGWLDAGDIPALLTFLKNRADVDPDRIGTFGSSIGGQVALRAAAENPEIRATVADGPSICNLRDFLPPNTPWRLFMRFERWIWWQMAQSARGVKAPPAVVDVIADISPRPVLLIAGGGLEADLVSRYYEFAAQPKDLWIIPEAGHGQTFTLRPEEYQERLLDFYGTSLSPEPVGVQTGTTSEDDIAPVKDQNSIVAPHSRLQE